MNVSKLLLLLLWLLIAEIPSHSYAIFCTFKASFQYAPTLVEVSSWTRKKPYHFTTHRIWLPSNTPSPVAADLQDNILEDHKEELLDWWPDLYSYDFEASKQYWKRMYNRSGSYHSEFLPPKYYIELGISLGKKYGEELIFCLERNEIFPNDTHPHSPSRIGGAIERELGAKPTIVCHLHQGKFYLKEIRLCFNYKVHVIDCFEGIPDHCDSLDQVYYPEP